VVENHPLIAAEEENEHTMLLRQSVPRHHGNNECSFLCLLFLFCYVYHFERVGAFMFSLSAAWVLI
jgi:hypothetical protein